MGLEGRRVLITRAVEDQAALAAKLRARGAEPLSFPCIAFAPPEAPRQIKLAVKRIIYNPPNAIALTSPYGAELFLASLRRREVDPRILRKVLVGATGEATARVLLAQGVDVLFPTEEAGGGPLAQLLIERLKPARANPQPLVDGPPRVLLPAAADPSPTLGNRLRAAGLRVEPLALYQTRSLSALEPLHGPGLAALRAGEVSALLFASGSAVAGFSQLLGPEALSLTRELRVACIGQPSAGEARALGLEVAAVGRGGLDSMLDALSACYSSQASPPAAPSGEETA